MKVLNKIFKYCDLSVSKIIRIVQTVVLLVALCECKNWILKSQQKILML